MGNHCYEDLTYDTHSYPHLIKPEYFYFAQIFCCFKMQGVMLLMIVALYSFCIFPRKLITRKFLLKTILEVLNLSLF